MEAGTIVENFAFIACKLWNFQINLVLRGLFYAYYTFFYGIHSFFFRQFTLVVTEIYGVKESNKKN